MVEVVDRALGTSRAAAMLATGPARTTPREGYVVVRLALGGLLVVAAVLKGYDLATGPVAGEGVFGSRAFLIMLVEIEWFFGAWLLSRLHPVGTRRAAICCFCIFACVSLAKGLMGEATCGCFGRAMPVSPWLTLALDIGAVLTLFRWRPEFASAGDTSHSSGGRHSLALRQAYVFSTVALVSVPASVVMARYRPAVLSSDGAIMDDSRSVILDP